MIYISGPMTGYEELNFPAFHAVAADLRAKGFNVNSPAEIELEEYPQGFVPTTTEIKKEMWKAFMKADIKVLMDSEKVAVMEGWEKSEGAQIEVKLAKSLGMEIICAYTLQPVAV